MIISGSIEHTYQIAERFHWMVDELYKRLFCPDHTVYALHHKGQKPYFHQDLMLAREIPSNAIDVFIK